LNAVPRILTDLTPSETVGRFDLEVLCWRQEELVRAGYPNDVAIQLAESPNVDLHRACEMLERGASVETAVGILL
jgi:hypothetical protein